MTAPAALNKTHDLLVELLWAINRHPLDEFTVRRIESQSDSLKADSMVDYLVTKGACATARNNVDQMKAYFSSAVEMGGSDPEVWYNYAVSCSILGLPQEMRTNIQESMARFDGSVDILQQSFACLLQSGALRSAAALAPTFERCGVKNDLVQIVASMADAIEANGYTEDDLMALVREARLASRLHGVVWPQPEVYTSYGFDGPSVVFDVHVNAEPLVARQVENSLFDRLAEIAHPLEASGLVTFVVTANPEFHGALRGAA